MLRVLVTLTLAFFVVLLSPPSAHPESYNAFSEFSLTQGGASGVWRYQESDGVDALDLIAQPNGVGFATGYPTWARNALELPVLFKDIARPDGLIFHPGVPANGPQPSRHDIVLRWTAPTTGEWDITGVVRGDSYFGTVGGNGIEFSVSVGQSTLLDLDIAYDDKTSHPIDLERVPLNVGESVVLRVYDKGNNEYDPGFLDVTVTLVGPDNDSDGVPDIHDNCPNAVNPDQANADLDGEGDACDPFPFDPDNEQAQCESDLSGALSTIAALTADADADGVRDLDDECEGTQLGAAVDRAGCSLAQFCGSITVQDSVGSRTCKRADWQNDEPLMTGRTQDCGIDRGGAGRADDRCAPRP